MDTLYISPSAEYELTKYCESNLLVEVMEHFAANAVIITRDSDSQPSRWWVITDYIKDNTIDCRKKLSVILSFAAIGGFVQIGDRMAVGDVNVLCMLKETSNISEENFDFFIDAFFNFSQGNGVKFS